MAVQGIRFTRHSRTVLLPILLLSGYGQAAAQMVTGRVIDNDGGRAIAGATIELTDTAGERRGAVVSDSAGVFSIVAPQAGRFRLRVTHVAYATLETAVVEAIARQQVLLELRLSSSAVALEPLRVVGRSAFNAGWLQEYYDRAADTRRAGTGRVFFRHEVERENVPYTSAFLTYLMPRAGCRPSVFVDGLEVSDAAQLNTALQPHMIEGVELYNNAAFLPPRYASRGHCAAALFWTRRDIERGRPFTWKRAFVAGGILSGILLLFRL